MEVSSVFIQATSLQSRGYLLSLYRCRESSLCSGIYLLDKRILERIIERGLASESGGLIDRSIRGLLIRSLETSSGERALVYSVLYTSSDRGPLILSYRDSVVEGLWGVPEGLESVLRGHIETIASIDREGLVIEAGVVVSDDIYLQGVVYPYDLVTGEREYRVVELLSSLGRYSSSKFLIERGSGSVSEYYIDPLFIREQGVVEERLVGLVEQVYRYIEKGLQSIDPGILEREVVFWVSDRTGRPRTYMFIEGLAFYPLSLYTPR